jgi:hypothetical protein
MAARHAATELTASDMEKVAGGLMKGDTVTNSPMQCRLDDSTDCWVTGGNFVFNDDAA